MHGVIVEAEAFAGSANDELLGLGLHRENGNPDGRRSQYGQDDPGKDAEREHDLEAEYPGQRDDRQQRNRADNGRPLDGLADHRLALFLHALQLRLQDVAPHSDGRLEFRALAADTVEIDVERGLHGYRSPGLCQSRYSPVSDQRFRSGEAMCESRVSKP